MPAADAGEVDAGMLVEILIFGGDERIDHKLRHRLDRQIKAALVGVFRKQRAIGRVHPRHHRRLVILQLRVFRQVLGKMPHQAGDGRDAGDEQNGSRREQKAEEPEQDFHAKRPAQSRPRPIDPRRDGLRNAPYVTFALKGKEPTRNRAKTPFDSFVVALVFVQTEAVRSLV